MKYLELGLDDAVWLKRQERYYVDFKENLMDKKRLPLDFCDFYLREEMHDHDLINIEIKRHLTKREKLFDLYTVWKSNDQIYALLFEKVRKLEVNFSPFGNLPDFIMGEFLAISDSILSCEMILFSDSRFYVEYSRLKYKPMWRL